MRIPTRPELEVAEPGLEGHRAEFLVSRREELAVLKTALKAHDFNAVVRIAHKWKGFSAPFGFGHLAFLAQELELSANEASLVACEALLQEVQDYLGN